MRALYKYPQRAFPYAELVEENRRRGRNQPEYELVDTGVFAEDRYFDVEVEYAKAAPTTSSSALTATNRGPEPAPLQLLPTLWFRNTWAWDRDDPDPGGLQATQRPTLHQVGTGLVQAQHPTLGDYWLACEGAPSCSSPTTRPTPQRLWGVPNRARYVKDGINDAHRARPVRPRSIPPDPGRKPPPTTDCRSRRARPRPSCSASRAHALADPFADADTVLCCPPRRSRRLLRRPVQRGPRCPTTSGACSARPSPACSGASSSTTTTSKSGSTATRPARRRPTSASTAATATGAHLHNADVISMPDKWEYPWYAAWDLAFHCIPLAMVDPDFAKRQLLLLLREWYMHPNGQIPGLRMGLRRRQSAGARLGGLARLQDRSAHQRHAPIAPFSSASSTSCCSTSPGG